MIDLPVVRNRSCGDCTACCAVLAVTELRKPYYATCTNVCAGCAIYTNRPQSCCDFDCVWKCGLLSEENKPNKVGILFNIDGCADGDWLELYEVWPGAFTNVNANISEVINAVASAVKGVRLYQYGSKIPVGFTIGQDYRDDRLAGKVRGFSGDGFLFAYTGPEDPD